MVCKHINEAKCDENCGGKDNGCPDYRPGGSCTICTGCEDCFTAEDNRRAEEHDAQVPEGA